MHLGPQFVRKSYDLATKEILRLKPDIVVATGDFTENGLLNEYNAVAEQLSKLSNFPLIAVPGNHDYRSTGYLIYKKIFGEKQKNELGKSIFFAVSTARPDRDEGEVGHRQNIWLEENLKRRKGRVKIIVMHHHLIQVPDTGTDRITIIDAGDVLKSILIGGADLVLSGHRHRPWMWQINDTVVVHAGTISSERTRGFFANTYNIIELNESSGEAKIWLKIIGGKKIDMIQIVKEQKPYMPKIKSIS
jgi:3',5'-cyclic AMP phosphodiesterase CpdA